MRRALAAPAAHVGFPPAPTKFHRTKAFPLGGRWLAAGETDEGRSVKIPTSGKNQRFHPSSVKNQRFLPASPEGEA